MQSVTSEFFLYWRRVQGYLRPELGVAEIYGDPDMSGSPIFGYSGYDSTNCIDADEEVVGILRGSVGERVLRITFITGEVIFAAAKHAKN